MLHALLAAASATPFHLGFLQRMSDERISEGDCQSPASWADGRCWLDDGWRATAAMGIAAVRDFNARDGSSVPQFGALTECDKQLVPAVYDTASTLLSTTRHVIMMHDTGDGCSANTSRPAALVGPARSSVVVGTLGVTNLYDTVSISYWASSTDLSDEASYPLFGRTFPTDRDSPPALCKLWSEFGYMRAGLLYSDDVYGNSVATNLKSACEPLGVRISRHAYTVGLESSIEQRIFSLAALQLRAIHLVVVGSSALDAVVSAALKYGLMLGCDTCYALLSLSDSVTA